MIESEEKINYLTMEALEDGLVASFSNNVKYCIDLNGRWMSLSGGEYTESIKKGQTLSFKASLTPDGSSGIGYFTTYGKYNLKGNCMSMLFEDNAAGHTDLTGYNYAFSSMFYFQQGLINVSKDFLPAKTLSNWCYERMFWLCESLVSAPNIPATTVGSHSCSFMFSNCSSLVNVPTVLPATTVDSSAYASMFSQCTSLTTAPELPATTIGSSAYESMFNYCTSLTTAPSILPATTLNSYCYDNMFNGCTSLTTAPELPATTLLTRCYNYMFYGCSSLQYIKAKFTTTPGSSYTGSWVEGVSSTGTFVKNRRATWNRTGPSGIPSGWTVKTE